MTNQVTLRGLIQLRTGDSVSEGDLQKLETLIGRPLPPDYREFLVACGGMEGYPNGQDFVCLWNARQVMRLNDAYKAKEFAPGVLLIGSNGCGECFAYDFQTDSAPLVQIPFVGLSRDRILFRSPNLGDFWESLGELHPVPNQRGEEIELVELKPILFGGDPRDPGNKAFLSREKHIEFVNYWNALLIDVRRPS